MNLEKFFDIPSVAYYQKDKEGEYTLVNQGFLKEYSKFTEHDIIGSKDIDLWGGNAPLFNINDQKVKFYEKNEIFIEEHLYENQKRFYLSFKNPWYSRAGTLLGISGVSILLNAEEQITNAQYSEELNHFLETLQLTYYKKNNYNLTPRQKECLKYLTKGMTIKQIANQLSLSHKTVEHYLETVKLKLNCANRHELIKKAFQFDIV